MKQFLVRLLLAAASVCLACSLEAQTVVTTCPGPTPGEPHVCLTWTTNTEQVLLFRATSTGAENYSAPLNATPLPVGTTAYYDTTVSSGTSGQTYYYTACGFAPSASGPGGVLGPPSTEVSAQVSVPPGAIAGFKANPD